jgi:hypothetical protein
MNKPIKQLFPKQELLALVYSGETKLLEEVETRNIGGSGDTNYYQLVFRDKLDYLSLWRVEYNTSLDHNAFDFHSSLVPCELVKAEQVLVTRYVTQYDEN